MDQEPRRTAWDIYFDVVMSLLRGFLFLALAVLVLIMVLNVRHFIEEGAGWQEWLQLLPVVPMAALFILFERGL
ncbi:MAG: hypothetical protein ACQRW7_08830, partial [Caulobacterales bacterium]|uniref:hypothetical protein n=1 Tax=Glycocaulis sp. TaxID=1969725 RepID=UPI003F9FF0A4